MPTSAKRPCGTVGCGNLVSSGRCAACQAKGKDKAPEHHRPTAAQRGYGSRWQKASKGWLARHPLCVDPYGVHGDRAVAATCTDHIVPHKGDMVLFWDSANWQSLCDSCHARKTATEGGRFGPMIDASVTLVCGAPGSGKSTYVAQHRVAGDLVWDFDVVLAALTGSRMHERAEGAVKYVLAMREGFYQQATRPGRANRVWIIESCPTAAERQAFEKRFAARIVLLETPETVCIERVRDRGVQWPAKVEEWWRTYRADGGGGANPYRPASLDQPGVKFVRLQNRDFA